MACIALLSAYAAKTYFRNWDWMSEDDLFISAQKVSGWGKEVSEWGKEVSG